MWSDNYYLYYVFQSREFVPLFLISLIMHVLCITEYWSLEVTEFLGIHIRFVNLRFRELARKQNILQSSAFIILFSHAYKGQPKPGTLNMYLFRKAKCVKNFTDNWQQHPFTVTAHRCSGCWVICFSNVTWSEVFF